MKAFLAFIFILTSLGCSVSRFGKNMQPFTINGAAQGTTYKILYYSTSGSVTKQFTDSIFNSIDSSLSIYKPYSLVTLFNNSSRGIRMDQHFKAVLQESIKACERSAGLFDVTVAPLVSAWGFGPLGRKNASPPDTATIQQLLSFVGCDKIYLAGDSLIKRNQSVKIDVNGIAQGYTVDVVFEILKLKGIKHFLVEIGGEIRTHGIKPNTRKPFMVGLERPSKVWEEEGIIDHQIPIRDEAITTSGKYRNYYKSENKIISHLIHPKTGFSVANNIISVSVIAPTAMLADALDNEFMNRGVDETISLLNRGDYKKVGAYFIYADSDGIVKDTADHYFKKKLHSSVTSKKKRE